MKKKNFLYTGTLALGMFMSGCSDSFLDMNNYGAYDDFNSETKITWYLAGLYQTSFENYTSPTSQYLGLYTSYAQDLTNSRMRCGESRLPAGLTRVRNIRPLMI